MTMKQNLNDVTFKISNVSLDHSGNYSCFYSTESHNLTAVAGTGQDEVEILVIGKSLFIYLSHNFGGVLYADVFSLLCSPFHPCSPFCSWARLGS